MGQIKVDKAGQYTVTLKADTIKAEKKLGLTLVSVRLVPSVR